MVATGYFVFDVIFGVVNSLLFIYFIAQVILFARLDFYKKLREKLKAHLHLTVRTPRIRTERSRSGSDAAHTNLSRQPSRSNRIGDVDDRDALSPSPAVLSPSASSALAAMGPLQTRNAPTSPSNSDSNGLLPDQFLRASSDPLSPSASSVQLAAQPARLITVDEHGLESSSALSSHADRGSRAQEEKVSGDAIRIQLESPPPHDSHISSEDEPPLPVSAGPLSSDAQQTAPHRASKDPVNFAPRSKSTSIPHVEFPVMGRIHVVFMAIGIIAGGLQVSRIPDALGVNDRYPLWLVRALSNAVAVVDIGLTTWVIYDFIRIRYITIFKFMPDWITRVLIASIVILTTVITVLVIVRSFYPDQWIWGMYSLWYGIDIILVLSIFDVCVYRLHMKIKEITSNWDENKKNFSPAVMRKTESSSRLLGLNRLSTSVTRRLTTSATPTPADSRKSKPSFSLRSFITDVLNPNASVEKELQAQTGVDRESGRLPERVSIFHALQRVVRQTVHLATAFTVVGGVVGIYLLYGGINKIANDPYKQLVIVNDPERFGSSTSDSLTSVVTTVFGGVVAWFSYIPFSFYFKDYTPLVNSAVAYGLLPATAPSACSPRIHF